MIQPSHKPLLGAPVAFRSAPARASTGSRVHVPGARRPAAEPALDEAPSASLARAVSPIELATDALHREINELHAELDTFASRLAPVCRPPSCPKPAEPDPGESSRPSCAVVEGIGCARGKVARLRETIADLEASIEC